MDHFRTKHIDGFDAPPRTRRVSRHPPACEKAPVELVDTLVPPAPLPFDLCDFSFQEASGADAGAEMFK